MPEPMPKTNNTKTLIVVGAFVAALFAIIVAVVWSTSRCTSALAFEKRSPDRQHLVSVTSIDCGATSGILQVKLEREGGNPSKMLYENEPRPNVDLVWYGNRQLVVRISDPKMIGKTEEFDGVAIRFESLPESN